MLCTFTPSNRVVATAAAVNVAVIVTAAVTHTVESPFNGFRYTLILYKTLLLTNLLFCVTHYSVITKILVLAKLIFISVAVVIAVANASFLTFIMTFIDLYSKFNCHIFCPNYH